MASSHAQKKGAELVAQAEKKLKAFNPFGMFGGDKYDDAAELYGNAAAQFKIAKDWGAAGDAYTKSAMNAEKSGDEHTACTKHVDAAKAYKNVNPKEAIKAYETAVQMHQDKNRFTSAAKLYAEIGALHFNQMNLAGALKAYKDSADCWKGEESIVHANQMLLKVADICAQQHDLKQAMDIYEQIVNQCIETNKMKHSCKDFLFKASMCQLVLGAKADNMEIVTDKVEKYRDILPIFDNCRESKLIDALAGAFDENNVDAYTEIVYNFDKITPLDTMASEMLLVVKQTLAAGGAKEEVDDDDGDGDGDDEESDDVDLS